MSTQQTFQNIATIALASASVGCAFGWFAGRQSAPPPVEVVDAVPVADMAAPAQPSRQRSIEVTTECVERARAAVDYPRTFRASVLSSTREPYGPGLWSVRVPFSAENAYGQRLDFVASCREIVGGTIVARVEPAR